MRPLFFTLLCASLLGACQKTDNNSAQAQQDAETSRIVLQAEYDKLPALGVFQVVDHSVGGQDRSLQHIAQEGRRFYLYRKGGTDYLAEVCYQCAERQELRGPLSRPDGGRMHGYSGADSASFTWTYRRNGQDPEQQAKVTFALRDRCWMEILVDDGEVPRAASVLNIGGGYEAMHALGFDPPWPDRYDDLKDEPAQLLLRMQIKRAIVDFQDRSEMYQGRELMMAGNSKLGPTYLSMKGGEGEMSGSLYRIGFRSYPDTHQGAHIAHTFLWRAQGPGMDKPKNMIVALYRYPDGQMLFRMYAGPVAMQYEGDILEQSAKLNKALSPKRH